VSLSIRATEIVWHAPDRSGLRHHEGEHDQPSGNVPIGDSTDVPVNSIVKEPLSCSVFRCAWAESLYLPISALPPTRRRADGYALINGRRGVYILDKRADASTLSVIHEIRKPAADAAVLPDDIKVTLSSISAVCHARDVRACQKGARRNFSSA